jgi:FkbH-like protein
MVSAAEAPAIAEALAMLRQQDAPMVDVMLALTQLDRCEAGFRTLRVGIASNVTVDLLAIYLRRHAYLAGVRLDVLKGSYDNLLGDVEAYSQLALDHLIIIPFFDNIQASWEAQLDGLDTNARQAPIVDYLARLDLALAQATSVGNIILAGAHLWYPTAVLDGSSLQVEHLADFNAALRGTADRHVNVRYLDTAAIVANIGMRYAFDARFYYRGKAPYTQAFINELARQISMVTRSFGSVFYKVLVLDCDNTLWGGIVGEDGLAGIQLDPYNYPGNIFWNIQQQVLALERQGVLICLCSKNNETDVDDVFARHEQMVLKPEHVVARRVNWSDKVSNLRALAAELNLGLESFVFVDDSSFEVVAMREQLPMVRVFEVPQRLTDYPAMLREISEMFLAGGLSTGSRSKTQQYRQLAEAALSQATFSSQEDYLRSLGLKVRLQRDAADQIGRISELMNKSNQFNLTTRRLMPGDVAALMASEYATVYSFSVSDRLADHGVTGVIITEDEADAVVVHSFLMSCRVIGRGVEFSVWKAVFQDAQSRGKTVLRATYVPSAKNSQVADFFDRLGFNKTDVHGDGGRYYEAQVASVRLADCNWVELING